VSIQQKSRPQYQQALITRRSKLPGLKQWNTSYNGEFATYHALYPESWTVYDLPGQNVKLTCHQISPVIPHNYDDSSLPTAVFNWSIQNLNDEDIEVSLMLTWQSGSGRVSSVFQNLFEYYKLWFSSQSHKKVCT
jgi:non-lysosomal glucosylceramidase